MKKRILLAVTLNKSYYFVKLGKSTKFNRRNCRGNRLYISEYLSTSIKVLYERDSYCRFRPELTKTYNLHT